MNPELQTTEELLKKGKHISLSVSERDEMKSQLLSYAQFHAQKEQPSKKEAFSILSVSMWFRSAATSALALVVFVGTGYASNESVPGEPLYAMKVHVVEELVEAMQFTEADEVAFKLHQLEERLEEIHELTQNDLLTAELLEESQEHFSAHIHDLDTMIGKSTSTLADDSVIEVASDAVSIVRAAGRLIQTEVSEDTADAFDSVIIDAVDVYEDEIESFVIASTEEELRTYIEEQLEEIAEEIAEEDLSDTFTQSLNEDLVDTNEALIADDVAVAVEIIGDALQNLETEEYTFDFEDEIAEI